MKKQQTSITSVDIEKASYGYVKEYSHYITKSRVLPHLDLKPVQRRVIWSMIGLKARNGSGRYIKSASVVGNALRYHPHGDSSVYSALCNLINMPNALVQGRGNFGGIYGDSAAAARYTEARTSELFESILDEYALELGDFQPNYDETDKEPLLFQTKIPIALLTSVNGIGVGLTTNSPSYHIDYIKALVKSVLEETETPSPEYAYGGTIIGNRVYPDFKVSKKNNKDYLHITSIPIGATAKIFNSSPLITELVSNKIIEIIDESTCDTISIFIKAPQDIQDMILDSMSLPIISGFKYYWKKLRTSGYVETWLEERKKFIKKREYYKMAKKFIEELNKCILSEISQYTGKVDQKVIEDITIKSYNKYIPSIIDDAKSFLPSESDLCSSIKSKSLSMIRQHQYTIPAINKITDEEIKNIIIAEVDGINSALFSPKTKVGKAIPYASFTNKIKRYIALRDNAIEVKYNKISRVLNWETEVNPIIIYHDGKTEVMNSYFFGTKEDAANRIAGFTFPGVPAVIVTESNKIKVLSRLGYINEPIKAAFPAKKMLINDKEYVMNRGLELSDVKSWKIIEV